MLIEYVVQIYTQQGEKETTSGSLLVVSEIWLVYVTYDPENIHPESDAWRQVQEPTHRLADHGLT